MALGRSQGSVQSAKFDPPAMRQATRFAKARATGATTRSVEVISLTGQWTNAYFAVAAGADTQQWADIEFELYAIVGSNEILLQRSTPRQATHIIVNDIIYARVLEGNFGGFPCNGFIVKLVLDARNPGNIPSTVPGMFTLYCWGEEPNQRPPQLLVNNNNGLEITNSVVYIEQPTHIKMVTFRNVNALTRYLFFYNANTAPPVGGSRPDVDIIEMLAGSPGGSMVWPDLGLWFDTGLVIAVSSTDRTFTASVTADVLATAYYREP